MKILNKVIGKKKASYRRKSLKTRTLEALKADRLERA
jgi:hypothetical protein